MYIVFNLVIVGLVLLIAYWWANQGLFSAILHLLCVIAAGAIALALWEPLVSGLLLRGTFFDDYAWGVGLILPFVIVLFSLRMLFDKSCGANVDLPRWANLTFGFAAGLAAGILTIGIFVIGAGFIQSHREIMGFTGHARSRGTARVEQIQTMWLPVHTLTYQFYGMLSAGALRPDFEGTPLLHYYPDLDKVAVSLHRDSADRGRGKTSLAPRDASVLRLISCDSCSPKRYAVEMNFGGSARDFGEQLTISSSQIRLIGRTSGFNKARVAHPIEFTQYSGHHKFDDISHYITSEPGQQQARVLIEFNANDLGTQLPRFIQVRGTRYRLPNPEQLDPAAYAAANRGTASGGVVGGVTLDNTSNDITQAVRQTYDIRPIQASVNNMPAGLKHIKTRDRNFLSDGEGEFFTSSGDRPGRGLGIEGIFEPPGTRIVQVDVSRSSTASLYRDDLTNLIGSQNPTVQLVDSQNRAYAPIGYIWTQANGRTRIKLDFSNGIKTSSQLPQLPTADTHRLKLLFSVTEGATVAGLKLGNATIGRCNISVLDPEQRASDPNASMAP